MPDLIDRLYCSEQIHIPPTFPFIMKLYCKAAIRTQPYDLLRWSAAYFRALANGEEPPVKDRIEYPPYDSPTGLTPGYIKVLIKQLGKDLETTVTAQTLFTKWNCVCLEDELLVKLIALMGSKTSINWLKFVAVAAGFITTSLTSTMILICELLTDEPEGGMATIPLEVFNELYVYLANMDCGPLSDEEKKQLGDMGIEEDASTIADKIRNAVYEGEVEGEENRLALELPGEQEIEAVGEMDIVSGDKEIEGEKNQSITAVDDVMDMKKSEAGEGISSEEESGGDIVSKESDVFGETGSREAVEEESSGKEQESIVSRESILIHQESLSNEEITPDEQIQEILKVEGEIMEEKLEDQAKQVSSRNEFKEDRKRSRRIKLEDIDESIRKKIEEKLEEDEETGNSEEGFDELSSYLLKATARVKTYSAEEIGYKIFKKYERQEVPGIGPRVDQIDIEKVIDFMEFNSHKQEGMVMPRNIRHWMCPPIDKMPIPEP